MAGIASAGDIGTDVVSVLREIGWRDWDPQGIVRTEKTWVQQRFSDEYYSYLKEAARRLSRDCDIIGASDYLS